MIGDKKFQKNLVVWKQYLKANIKRISKVVFQKNLVVWKQYPHLYKTNQFTKVSEELSSVETLHPILSYRYQSQFQKNLVVWKLVTIKTTQ